QSQGTSRTGERRIAFLCALLNVLVADQFLRIGIRTEARCHAFDVFALFIYRGSERLQIEPFQVDDFEPRELAEIYYIGSPQQGIAVDSIDYRRREQPLFAL